MERKKMSFPAAMLDYFGRRPGHPSAKDFMDELKALTNADKIWFRQNLATVGYDID